MAAMMAALKVVYLVVKLVAMRVYKMAVLRGSLLELNLVERMA
jgi:hypothetical protein